MAIQEAIERRDSLLKHYGVGHHLGEDGLEKALEVGAVSKRVDILSQSVITKLVEELKERIALEGLKPWTRFDMLAGDILLGWNYQQEKNVLNRIVGLKGTYNGIYITANVATEDVLLLHNHVTAIPRRLWEDPKSTVIPDALAFAYRSAGTFTDLTGERPISF